jgi:hypothetical protein
MKSLIIDQGEIRVTILNMQVYRKPAFIFVPVKVSKCLAALQVHAITERTSYDMRGF